MSIVRHTICAGEGMARLCHRMSYWNEVQVFSNYRMHATPNHLHEIEV